MSGGADMKTTEKKSDVRERWYVTTDFFRDGGKYIAGLGPWDTRELALACRTGYEAATGRNDLYVDVWEQR